MAELIENWTSTDLNLYINSVRENEREKVLEEILDKKRLRQYLDTPDGRLILKDAVNIIRVELVEIYKLVIDDAQDNVDKIVKRVNRYRTTVEIMYRWMDMLKKGEAHEKKMLTKKK